MSYAVTIFFKTSGTIPWSSIVGYWSLRFSTTKGVLSGPTKRVDTAKMHCIRFATGERPHNSLNDTTAFCKKERKSFLYSNIWILISYSFRLIYLTVIAEQQRTQLFLENWQFSKAINVTHVFYQQC